MRRFREVERNIERENLTNNNNDKYEFDFDKRIGEEGFMRIKPETNITYEESVGFLHSLFDQRI